MKTYSRLPSICQNTCYIDLPFTANCKSLLLDVLCQVNTLNILGVLTQVVWLWMEEKQCREHPSLPCRKTQRPVGDTECFPTHWTTAWEPGSSTIHKNFASFWYKIESEIIKLKHTLYVLLTGWGIFICRIPCTFFWEKTPKT